MKSLATQPTAQISHRRWWMLFGVLAVAVIGWWLVLQFIPEHETKWNFYFNIAYALPYLFAGIAIFVTVFGWRKEHYSETAPLVLLGIRCVLYAVAQAAWTWYNVAENVAIPEFSIADVFWISAVLIEIMALTAMLIHRLGQHRFSRPIAIGLVVGAVVVSFGIVRFLFSWLYAGEQTLFSLESFYSISSFVVLFLVIFNLNRDRHPELRGFWYGMLFAAMASAAGDTLYAFRNTAGTYWNGDVSDGVYALAGIFALYAVLRIPSRISHVSEEGEENRSSPLRVVLPIAIVVAGILLAARFASVQFDDRNAALDERTGNEARRVAEVFEGVLREDVTDAAALSALRLSDGPLSKSAFNAFVAHLLPESPDADGLFMLDPEGRVIQSAGSQAPPLGFDYATDPDRGALLARVIDSRRAAVSVPLKRHDGRPGFIVLDPIYEGDTYLGASGVAISLPELMPRLAALFPGEGFTTTFSGDGRIVSADGRTVYGLDGKPLFGAASAPVPLLATNLPGSVEVPVEGPGKGWTVTVSPSAEARNGVYSNALGFFIIILLLMAAMAVIAFLLVSQRERLQEQLRVKTYSLRQTISDLKQSKFFLDNVSDTVIVLDRRRKTIYQNKAAQETFGLTEDAPHDADWLYDIAGVTHEEVDEAIQRTGKWDGEAKYRDGKKEIDVLVSFRPLYDDQGKIVANLALARDITDRKNIERTKTQFVSMVAHQLRAPMTQMRWLVEQMLEDKKLPKAILSQLKQAEDIVLAENQFVGDLLNVSRIERGVLKLEKAPIDVSDLIERTITPLQPLAHERHIKISVKRVLDASVKVDAEKTVQALRNLVDNAIKYSPEWTEVTLAASKEAGMAVIKVSDQGKGIPKELQTKLFDIKTEISPNATLTTGSTGLGLYLTKKFVDAMGGSVTFETGPHGTTFEVRLPIA